MIPDRKKALRLQLRAALGSLSTDDLQEGSERILERARDLPAWKNARQALLFHPTVREPALWPLAVESWAAARRVFLPRFVADAGTYCAAEARPGAELVPGPGGILEPSASAPVVPLNRLDFVLVPGLGFHPDGRRLGRGKGHYDRLLAEISGFKCGVAFDLQLVEGIPTEPHDVRLDWLLTPTLSGPCRPAART